MIFFHQGNSHNLITNPDLSALKKQYSNAWKNDSFPQKQWARVEKQLQRINDIPEFRAIIDCVKATNIKKSSILEIGCSSGYLSEILKKKGIKATYEGTDYSQLFIDFAEEKYPGTKFTINDATNLHYKGKSFDIVISGCCILHIINYKKAIAEASRVTKKFIIFHRTPILHFSPTSFFKKTAYDSEMLDIYFNEKELIDLFNQNGLVVVKIVTISKEYVPVLKEDMFVKNYLCRKL